MKRIIVAVVAVAGIAGLTGVSSASTLAAGPSVCVNGHIDLNGTAQDINQCLPS